MITYQPGLFSTRGRSLVMVLQRLLDPSIVVYALFATITSYGYTLRKTDLLLGILAFFLGLPIFKLAGLYRSYRGESPWAEAPRLLTAWGIQIALLLGVGFVTQTTDHFPRLILLTWFVLVPILLLGSHVGLRLVLHKIRALNFNTRTAVVAGSGTLARQLQDLLARSPHMGIRVGGYFDRGQTDYLPYLGSLADLPSYVKTEGIDLVYLAIEDADIEQIDRLIEQLKDTTASVYYVPKLLTYNLTSQGGSSVGIYPLFESPFADESLGLIKRLCDIVFASLILLLISPLMLLIALGVKLSSSGPILFKQRRYGLNGQEILIYKFRSMTVMEDGHQVQQARLNDNRVTPFGAFLRRTSLDELPQFINVLQGRMSIVGPRPHAIAHNEEYRRLISGYMLRHKVKPGITGWAQIHGYRGETDTLEKMERRVEYDLHYVSNWSFMLDLVIIAKTFAVFTGKNAY